MKTPQVERLERSAAEEPQGWRTIASIQTNGKDLAVQIDGQVVHFLDRNRVDKLIACLTDALYRVRPDLRAQ